MRQSNSFWDWLWRASEQETDKWQMHNPHSSARYRRATRFWRGNVPAIGARGYRGWQRRPGRSHNCTWSRRWFAKVWIYAARSICAISHWSTAGHVDGEWAIGSRGEGQVRGRYYRKSVVHSNLVPELLSFHKTMMLNAWISKKFGFGFAVNRSSDHYDSR